MKVSAIIVAAGKGVRLSNFSAQMLSREEEDSKDLFKQFLPINGKPILVHTVIPFDESPLVNEIIIVVPADKVNYCKSIMRKYSFKKIKGIIPGGKFRQDSVYDGLLEIGKRKPDIVLVHDGVRPLITQELIQKCLQDIRKFEAIILAVPVKETIKFAKKLFIEETPDRNKLWSIQTPQCFTYNLILRAYRKARSDEFLGSDDASLVERLEHPVRVEMGSYENIKITTPEDFILAEELLKRRGR